MLKKILSVALVATISVTSSFAGDKINGAGASFPAPLYYDWAYNYKKETKNSVNYQSIGSGGGIKQIAKRVVNFGASDKPLNSKKLVSSKLLQKLPNQKIIVVHRSDGSGTTYNFTYYLSGSSKNWKENFGIGKAIDWAVGIGGKGNEGVANLVKQTPYSIGYIENAYKEKNHLSAAVLKTANGKWVVANEDNFKSAAKYASWTKEDNFYAMLALQPGDTSYPIVAATFILLPVEKADANKKVIKFYDYAFKTGDKSAKKLGYIALPDATKNMIREYWAENIE